MNTPTRLLALIGALMLALAGCGPQNAQPARKTGVVYLDPNAATAAPAQAGTDAPLALAPVQPSSGTEGGDGDSTEPEAPLDLYIELRGVRLEPLMEAAPVLAALGEPLRRFEADSCAYVGKDVFYAYPGVQLTVNEVEGVARITLITVTDDTVSIPQGLRIYDDEEKLLDLLGGTEDNGVYAYRSGRVELIVAMQDTEDDVRRIAYIEYRVAQEP